MWPFSVLRRHKHERRYRAARLVMLGRYTYARLTPDDVVITAVPARKASVPRPMTVGSANYRVARFVFQLYSNYRYADPATEAARLDLVGRGADIPAVDLESLNQRVVGPGGRIMTLRERWLQLRPPDRS
jgi:hypothetical protein